MGLFTAFDINASGLTAQQFRMDVISQNVANATTTRTEDGTPYRRKVVTFMQKDDQTTFSRVMDKARDRYSGQGVKVAGVYEDTWTTDKKVYDPSHPDADASGYVTYPNVNIVTEMTNLIDATRAFEANNTALTAGKAMMMKALEISQ